MKLHSYEIRHLPLKGLSPLPDDILVLDIEISKGLRFKFECKVTKLIGTEISFPKGLKR